MYAFKTPKIFKLIYPSCVWNYTRKDKKIYLTFDDGPIPEVTPWLLDLLKEYNAKATFFCVGENVKKYPDIYKTIVDSKHRVGNHTFNHIKGWENSTKNYSLNIEKCNEYFITNLFRPPHGQITPMQVYDVQKKYKIIMWDILSGDFDNSLSQEDCLHNVLKYTKNGSIIVFHDSLKAEKKLRYVLPKVLKYWSEQGFSFEIIE